MSIIHVVLLQYKKSISAAKIEEMNNVFLNLKTKAIHPESKQPYIAELTGGKNVSYDGMDAGYQYAFTVVFNTVKDRDYYASHDPAHEAFAEDMKQKYLEKIIVIDYKPGSF